MQQTEAAFSTELRVNPDSPRTLPVADCDRGDDDRGTGYLIINADDWGRDRETTELTLACILHKTVSSVSAMVFMADSERAAEVAQERLIDAGLHLNFTTPFSASSCTVQLVERQRELAAYLTHYRLAQVFFHPRLASSFEYVVLAQMEEFRRLYGNKPERIDGHHHMHLCSNVLLGGLLPPGTVVRRSVSFQPGEKSLSNLLYRRTIDRILVRRHRLTDFFFSLSPVDPFSRLQTIFSLARRSVVEVETHPVHSDEYSLLMGKKISHLTTDIPIRGFAAVRKRRVPAGT